MKRRATNRRQVLDLDTNSSSPKISWQTKYQQICLDHMSSTISNAVAGEKRDSEVKEKKLPLVGYGSDSESESEHNKSKGDIDSKVEDFLKELSDSVPVKSNEAEKAKDKVKTTKSSSEVDSTLQNEMELQSSNAQPTIAWQECYDENSGCYYYWHTETNEVTWEIPAELQAYRVALEQWNAQQLLLAQRARGGLVPMYAAMKPVPVTVSSLQQNKTEANNKNSAQAKPKNKRSKSKSDSEDEKIELITSYGPNSDDDDEDSDEHEPTPSKKKKTDGIKAKKKRENEELTMGPQLPPGYVVEEDEPAPPGDEENYNKAVEMVVPSAAISKTNKTNVQSKPKEDMPNGETMIKIKMDETKVSVLQRLKDLKSKDTDESDSEESDVSEEKKSNSDLEDDDVENSILEKLKKRAKILKSLGGEIPEEIKDLIEPEPEINPTNNGNENKADVSKVPRKEAPLEANEIISTQIEELSVLAEKDLVKTNLKKDLVDGIDFVTKPEQLQIKNIEIKSSANGDDLKLEKVLALEQPVSSFSLIAGYGNEDDSETEDDKSNGKVDCGKPTPLFPIMDSEKEKPLSKNANVKVIKLSAKAKELIHSSTTTGRARATEFNATSDGLRPEVPIIKENKTVPVIALNENLETEPLKKNSRKKRLEIPKILKPEPKPVEQVESSAFDKGSEEKSERVASSSDTAYSNAWSYNSELRGDEHRGFGYANNSPLDTTSKPTTFKKGMIQFVKSDTLMPKNEPVVSLTAPVAADQEEIVTSELTDKAKDLAQVISEKVKFLSEGKGTVPPVQVMAIQLETLMTALGAGGLSVKYLWEWLSTIDKELASLEQAAAPRGFLCQWDRSYKRYFYRNEESGSIQWEYPAESIAPEVQGGEEAMELCDSPPPQPPPGSPPPPPPPPRISSRTPSPHMTVNVAPPLPPLPPPPPVISEQPPPPPETPPPPPLPPSPPPPPPPPVISAGEPLPPGVDPPEDMYETQPPLPVAPPPPSMYGVAYVEPDPNIPLNTMHYEPYPMHTTGEYMFPSASAEYGGSGENYVIARAPANNPQPPVPSLATELDSFYSEVAALDPPLPPQQPAPSPPPPPSSPPPEPAQPPVEPAKKKKKTKLTPGLALKKKGVHSLVAKWQQVQQDVRREAKSDET